MTLHHFTLLSSTSRHSPVYRKRIEKCAFQSEAQKSVEKWAYRGESSSRIAYIRKNGVIPIGPPTPWNPQEGRLYFTDSVQHAKIYNSKNVIRFPWPEDATPDRPSEWYTRVSIPIDVVQIEAENKWVPLQIITQEFLAAQEAVDWLLSS